MARFYARFDNAATAVLSSSAYSDKRIIAANSASGALLRDGLIASRSLLSTNALAQVNAANRIGSSGSVVPSDVLRTNASLNEIYWNTIYTSSAVYTPAGIIIPTDFRTRPSSSVLSTSPTIVGPASPLDPATASFGLYSSASVAVSAALASITSESALVSTPYTRVGATASRTLASIFYDADMNYFGWDDFRPGPGLSGSFSYSGNSPLTINFAVVMRQAFFLNDRNPFGYIGFKVDLEGGVNRSLNLLLSNGTHLPGGALIQIGSTYSTQTGPTNGTGGGNSTWSWDAAGTLSWVITMPAGTYTVTGQSQFYDVTSSFAGDLTVSTSDTKTVT